MDYVPELNPLPIADSSYTGPWHEGERAMQSREGVREMMEEVGQRVLRNYMPDQHRTFFAQLPFMLTGSIDAQGQPWAGVLASPAGFATSPDPQHLRIAAAPLAGDPLADNLYPGAPIALLGIEPHTRRRNRMNGIVERVEEDAFSVRVVQSFGNCPKYIQARKPEFLAEHPDNAGTIHRAATLDAAARALIAKADTFFIATAHPHAADNPAGAPRYQGVDVSHRGGKPGFVRIDTDAKGTTTLTVPDFTGNQFFNTLGNLQVNPRAGLLFIDFDSGDLLYVTVRGEVIWDGEELVGFAGAHRLMRLAVTGMQRTEAVLPLRFGAAAQSPFLDATGAWRQALPQS
jgi:predicted pyridoxine 5'-phosphate oxidase superfamily flavin-nucleotide-binding protein